MKKLLLVTLAVALGAVTASAATDYGISVNGTAVKSDKLSSSTGGGTVSYNVSSNTLMLSAVSFNRSCEALKVSYNTNRSGTLKIVFSGSCQLVSTGNDGLILEDDVDFTVSDATTLGTTASACTGEHCTGITASLTRLRATTRCSRYRRSPSIPTSMRSLSWLRCFMCR